MTTQQHTHPTLNGRACIGKHCRDHVPAAWSPTEGKHLAELTIKKGEQ